MSKIIQISIVLLSILSGTAQTSVRMESKYVCPPCNSVCDTIEHEAPGVCAHCNMVLVKKTDVKTIAFYLQDGVEVLDFAGPLEVFAYSGYKVFTVSATKSPITSQGVLTVVPDYDITDAPKADILAFFGGNSSAVVKNPKVIEWVKRQENVQHYFSVCTGAFILAEAGILENKTATTFHNALEDLATSYPDVNVRKNVRFVDNGDVITTAGISAGIDGALHLVAKLRGVNAAKRTAYYMEYDTWEIGDGLILSENNPYQNMPLISSLETYVGRYEFENGAEVEVKLDTKKGDLYALFDELVYPLYHEKDDIFSDTSSRPIYFKRNGNGEVIGYSTSKDGKLFRKL